MSAGDDGIDEKESANIHVYCVSVHVNNKKLIDSGEGSIGALNNNNNNNKNIKKLLRNLMIYIRNDGTTYGGVVHRRLHRYQRGMCQASPFRPLRVL
jgi:hypothetical protein